MISSAKDNGMRLISIVTGTNKDDARISASRKLLNYGFRFFETHLMHKANTEITKIRVWKGDEKQLSLGITHDLYVTTPKGLANKIKNNIKIEAMIEAPVAEGKAYGKINIKLRDKQIASTDLVALSSIKEGGMWRKLTDNIQLMFQ